MITPKSFYEGFQINHFDIKQINNKNLLAMSDKEIGKVTSELINCDKNEFLRSVKMDARFTYLMAIETLFEIIFSLIPDNPNKLNDHQILQLLMKKTSHYEDIRNFANSEPSKMDRLEEMTKYNNGEELTLWRYLFYLGVRDEIQNNSIDASLEVIKKALRLFAKDLTNRDELNGYKHGLRGIRHLVSFQIGSKDNPDMKYLNFQTNDALSYYSFDKDTNNHVLKTLEFDPEKDIKMTHYASNLLYNIIEPRKYIYGKKIGEELTILHFNEASLDHVSKPNIQFQNMTFKYQI